MATRAAEFNPAASPDGRWLAFGAEDTGRGELYVVPYGRPGARRQISRDGVIGVARWSKRGTEPCYRSGQSVECIKIGDDGTAQGTAQRILTAPPASGSWDVSPDGERFYLLGGDNEGRLATAPIQVVLSWFEELRAKASPSTPLPSAGYPLLIEFSMLFTRPSRAAEALRCAPGNRDGPQQRIRPGC